MNFGIRSGPKQLETLTQTTISTKTDSIALTSMMIIGVGGILAILMSAGTAASYGCGGYRRPAAPTCSSYTEVEFKQCFNQQATGVCEKYDFDKDGFVRGQDNKLFGDKIESCMPTVSVTSGTNTQTNVIEGMNDVALGQFIVQVNNEPVTIQSAGWQFLLTSESADISDITNVTVSDTNGTVLAGPLDPIVTGNISDIPLVGIANSTDFFSLDPGTHALTLRASLSVDYTRGDTIQTRLYPPEMDIVRNRDGEAVVATPDIITNGAVTIKETFLNVSNSPIPASQSIVFGAQDFNSANFILDASESGDDVRVVKLEIAHQHTGESFPNMLSGWKIFDGNNQVPINSESTSCSGISCNTRGTNATTTLTIRSGALTVEKGTVTTLKVTNNVGTGASTGTFRVFCGDGEGCVTAIDGNAHTTSNTYDTSHGQIMILAGQGKLNVTIQLDPDSALVVGGSTVEVGRFTLEPKLEGVNIDFLGFSIHGPDGGIVGHQDELQSITVREAGGSIVGSVPIFTGRATITPSGLSIGVNVEKTYIVEAKFNKINDSTPAESGAGIRVELSNIDATGTNPGSSGTMVQGLGTSFNTFSIFKSLPTIRNISFSGDYIITDDNTEMDLMKFSVTADSAGPVALYKASFGWQETGVTLLDEFRMYVSDTSSSLGDLISRPGDTIATIVFGSQNSLNLLEVYLDVNDNNTNEPANEHSIVSAGSTKYFTIRGSVTGHDGVEGNESIGTQLLNDLSFAGTSQLNAAGVDATPENNFIWSDLHFDLYATSSAPNTKGFSNGYRVPGLLGASTWAQFINDGPEVTVPF